MKNKMKNKIYKIKLQTLKAIVFIFRQLLSPYHQLMVIEHGNHSTVQNHFH